MIVKFRKIAIALLPLLAVLILSAIVFYSEFRKKHIVGTIQSNNPVSASKPAVQPRDFAILWWTDFNHNRVVGFNPQGQVVWMQNMSAPPIPHSSWYYIGGVERVTVAPNGNLITSYGDAMIVEELDRKTHNQVWQYGITGLQSYRGGFLDEPHKSFKINDHEVVINDSNDREVIVVDQNTNQVVWQYGEYHKMGSTPGLLRGNTSVCPVDGGKEFLITDTLEKKIMLVDRATKNIVWEWSKPDSQWLENVFVTKDNTFVLSDRLKGEVFEINRDGQMLWDLTKLSDEERIGYPTDAAKLENGDVLIAEAGKNRIVEAVPTTGRVVRQYLIHGTVTTIAVDYNGLDAPDSSAPSPLTNSEVQTNSDNPKTFTVNDFAKDNNYASGQAGGQQTFSGKVADVNASTARAGSLDLAKGDKSYGVEVYNYSRVINKSGAVISLGSLQKDDEVLVKGTISGSFVKASLVQDNSR